MADFSYTDFTTQNRLHADPGDCAPARGEQFQKKKCLLAQSSVTRVGMLRLARKTV